MRSLENASPFAAFFTFAAIIGIVMFCRDPITSSVSLFFSILYYFLRNGTKNFKTHVFAFLFFLLIVVINPFFYRNGATVLFLIGDSPITLEALIYGLGAGEMVISVVYWFRSFTEIMTEDKLISLLGVFSPKFSLMLSMVFRFIPLFSRRAKSVNDAQRVLGLYKDDNIIDSVRVGAGVLSGVSGWALENGIITSDSMAARGYGSARRTSYSIYRSKAGDYALIFVVGALLASSVALVIAGEKFVFYPSIVVPGGALNIIFYICYGVLCAVPSVLRIYEVSKWKYLESKI